MEGKKFRLPVRLKAEEIEAHLRGRRCVVVGFMGKSPLAARWGWRKGPGRRSGAGGKCQEDGLVLEEGARSLCAGPPRAA